MPTTRRWQTWRCRKTIESKRGDLLQHVAKRFQSRDTRAGLLSLPQRFPKQAIKLQRSTLLEVNQRRGFIGTHGASAVYLFICERNRNLIAERTSSGDDLVHQFAGKIFPARIGQQFIGREDRAQWLASGE